NTAIFAMVMIGALALSGCKINPKEAQYYPKIAGNTYELQNQLATVLPVVERINVSYEFAAAENGDTYIDAPGMFSGPAWWYEERSAELPEQFLAIHLLKRDDAYTESSGTLVKLSRTSYNGQTFCVDTTKDDVPPEVKVYIDSLKALGHPISTDLYVRRFVLRKEREGNERTDIIYIRDIVRLGYTCESLGDVVSPSVDREGVVNMLRTDSQAAFEVMS
ncbi:MAG: hypothetical protein P1V34_06115, partial [Alphaproteobacteria bacterium]|nr:hypothetical protein [Alphaproteobacteria bacterium]